MIDNLNKICNLLEFNSEDDFYHLQIIKRKKEHPELGSNSYVVKTYYIRSVDHLNKRYDEIKAFCNHHNARACINLNRRSFEKIAFHTMKTISDQLMNRDFKSVRNSYNRACGKYSNESNKKWILDFDSKDVDYYEDVKRCIMESINIIKPDDLNKLIDIIPTKNGFHFITKPFAINEFNKQMITRGYNWNDILDIHKNNPTIIYIP